MECVGGHGGWKWRNDREECQLIGYQADRDGRSWGILGEGRAPTGCNRLPSKLPAAATTRSI